MRIGRGAARVGVGLLAFLALDMALGWLTLGDGYFLGRPVAPFDPPLFSPAQRESLARIEAQLAASAPPTGGKFDAELGWCNHPESGHGDYRYDWAGARIGSAPLPRDKAAGTVRVVAIGCSMTHGEEVGPGESWCARLDAEAPDLEIANLGVAAYGIDQALLRLRRDGLVLQPDEVWLGVLPQAALRVTTLFRPLLDHWSLDVAFKPRFFLSDAGELVLVPNPVGSQADIARLLHDQRAFLAALGGRDPWIERAPNAYEPRGSHWAHWFFSSRLLLSLREGGGRDPRSCFAGSADEARLFLALVRETERETRARGAVFRLLVLPGKDDLLDREANGRGYWEAWAERLVAEGTFVLDLSAALRDSGEPLDRLFAPNGHYTREASLVVARAIQRRLAAR